MRRVGGTETQFGGDKTGECTLACPAMSAAEKLFRHLQSQHVRDDGALVGPDPGVSLNLRVTRFIKSYTRFLPWWDRLYYLQAQAYWIIDNVELYRATGRDEHKSNALRCADVVSARQTDEGYWKYPQTEWGGRVATVEGCFGALSLLEAFGIGRDQRYLEGAKRWHEYMVSRVGFQEDGLGGLAVNYFSNVGRGMVPNNATLALWLEAALAAASEDEKYVQHADGLISFLANCQKDNGELPYVVGSESGPEREHYLCFQYNAFQFLDLAEYYRITNDDRVLPVMRRLAEFLAEGLTVHGDARHDCSVNTPTMHYYTSAVAAALHHAAHLRFGGYGFVAERACQRLCSVQRTDGGFDYSWGDYGFLSDRRSYPRNQSMIIRHMLMLAGDGRLRAGD